MQPDTPHPTRPSHRDTTLDRRRFLQIAGVSVALAGTSWACNRSPGPIAKAGPGASDERSTESAGRYGERVLVLVELQGGNDGLNTVVPYRRDAYYRARPGLAVDRDEVLSLDDDVGLHPSLAPLMSAWDAGELAVVQGLGYPNPNRSHFRSIEIWDTGSAGDHAPHGWIERTVGSAAAAMRDALAADGVVIGQGQPGPLDGDVLCNIAMARPDAFVQEARHLQRLDASTGNPALDHVIGIQNELLSAARTIEDRLAAGERPSADFPRTRIGRQLDVAARLLVADVPVGVVKVQHGSFDTHAGQSGQHGRLLEQLADALVAFRTSLASAGRADDVLIMTYSEFGRRVAENGSGGTDHGTAAPQLLLGPGVAGGVHGEHPDLEDLDDGGDMKFTTDFRSLYNAVATRWWGLRAPFDSGRYGALGVIG